MDPSVEWRMWRQIRGAFKINRFVFTPTSRAGAGHNDTFPTMEAALQACQGNRVFLEPKGERTLAELPPRDEDVVFVLGNTGRSNAKYAAPGETYRIWTPGTSDLYGINAAAIALSYWWGVDNER